MIVQKSDYKKYFNRNVLKLLNKNEYNIEYKSPLELLSANRIDIVAKYIYLKYYKQLNLDFAKKLYLEHIKAFNGFVERDESNKVGGYDFIESFEKLINSIRENGIKDTIIPILEGNFPIDGAHRIACALFFNESLPVMKINRYPKKIFNYKFYLERGLDRKYLDFMVLEYAKLKNNCYMILIWPRAIGKDYEVYETINRYGDIVYKKEIKLTESGMVQLIRHVYKNESWIGSYNNDFEGARNKARWCFSKEGILKVFMIEKKDKADLLDLKQKIRELFNIEKHSVHINDTIEETIELAEILFNDNSIFWLNNSIIKENKNFNLLFNQYANFIKNNKLNKTDFCIVGGILPVFGVNDAKDLDYINKDNKEYDFKNKQIELETDKFLYCDKNYLDVIYNPDLHFYAYSHKFIDINLIYKIKLKRKKGKDLEDLKILEDLRAGKLKINYFFKLKKIFYISFWKRQIKFILLKIRFLFLWLLKKIKGS